jgi:CBS domain-containing protein
MVCSGAMAALDPVAFLRATPPFDALSEGAFETAAKALEIAFFPKGSVILKRGGEPSRHLYVIRKGAVRLERDGQTLQLLEEGEIFGFTSLITGKATLDVSVEEDLLAYRLPREVFQALLAHAPFAGHFATGLGERLKNSLERSQAAPFQANLSVPVGSLIHRSLVRVAASATVGEAARVMREQGVSSALVDTDPPGIVTDSDFRCRVLAAGLGPGTPVTQVYTAPLRAVPETMPIYEAWQTVLEGGIHHLPVTRGGEIVGVLTSNDLLKQTATGPVSVLKRVERLADRDSLPGYAAQVAEMTSALLAGGLECIVIAGFVARLNDTLLARILHWAESDLGPPPVPYAWIVFGSEGRMEQTLLTDQDNAIVYGEDAPEAREYFAKLAEKAIADLVAAGFPRCTGGYMATGWQGPLDEWLERFQGWVDNPTPKALLEASIFFDFRRVHGALALDRLEEVMQRCRKERVFLSAMAKAALNYKPPTGLLLRLRGESSRVDLKANAISPIVFLARCYGLEVGARTRNTLERLQATVDEGLLGPDEYATLSEAYRFLLRVRLREQLRMLSGGNPANNVIALSDLSSIERSRLKDTFRAIEVWQERAAYHYRTDYF